jgi:hypothetical protein
MAKKIRITLAALTFCQLYHRMLALRSGHVAWDGNGVRRMASGLASFLVTPLRSAGSKTAARIDGTNFLEFGLASSHARSAGDDRRRFSDRIFRRVARALHNPEYATELLTHRITIQDAITYSLPSVHGLNHFCIKAAQRSAWHQRLARAFHNSQAQTSRLGEKTFTRHHPHPLQLSPCLSDSA